MGSFYHGRLGQPLPSGRVQQANREDSSLEPDTRVVGAKILLWVGGSLYLVTHLPFPPFSVSDGVVLVDPEYLKDRKGECSIKSEEIDKILLGMKTVFCVGEAGSEVSEILP